ncbi:hypothetical protein J6590_000671 [Homalodisca vitripennis]|nr:hypothetical protein J6590_000671 [Homalodisca vitripennis]
MFSILLDPLKYFLIFLKFASGEDMLWNEDCDLIPAMYIVPSENRDLQRQGCARYHKRFEANDIPVSGSCRRLALNVSPYEEAMI